MKKILAAFDGFQYAESTQAYGIFLARATGAKLVGVFLEDESYRSYKIYDLITEEGGSLDARRRQLDKKDSKTRAAAITRFTKACTEAGIRYAVHKDRRQAIQELLKESIYADLLVIGCDESFSNHPEVMATTFLRQLLPDVQCPVMLVPRKYRPVDSLVFLYDGQPSSVHALKMAGYILDNMKQLPVNTVTAYPFDTSPALPGMALLKEFVGEHFSSCHYTRLTGVPDLAIVNYLKNQDAIPLVVLGAYRRGWLSRWFRTSLVDVLMKELKLPLFIAHNP